MYLFAQHPHERERLRQHPGLVAKAVEEILRFESPVQMAARTVAEDVELAGRVLERGQRVEVLLGAANRDPAVFRTPEQFDIGRSPNPHLAFGMGRHYCVGAALARLIGSIALPRLIERVRVLELAPLNNPWGASVGFRGLSRLPCSSIE
ncbi:MAG: cytochrome P450 [Opitutaceae bacterium]